MYFVLNNHCLLQQYYYDVERGSHKAKKAYNRKCKVRQVAYRARTKDSRGQQKKKKKTPPSKAPQRKSTRRQLSVESDSSATIPYCSPPRPSSPASSGVGEFELRVEEPQPSCSHDVLAAEQPSTSSTRYVNELSKCTFTC